MELSVDLSKALLSEQASIICLVQTISTTPQWGYTSHKDGSDHWPHVPFQVAERLEGAPGCAQFPQAFRDLHSQVRCEKMWLCKLPPPLLLYFWLHVLFPIMFSTSFVFCRLLAVTTPRQLPPGLVSAVSSSTCGAPCLRPCSPQLVEPGKKLLEEEKKTTLPEGVCKKVSKRGVDDQPCCWKGHRGCLITKNGHQTRKMHFSVESSHVRL